MEELVGLLVIVAIYIFKAVNKKLGKAGQLPSDPQEQEMTDPDLDFKRWVAEAMREAGVHAPKPAPAPEMSPAPAPEKVKPSPVKAPEEKVVRQVPVRKPILTETPEKEKEKIDLRKMIIYSEIMSPKYKD